MGLQFCVELCSQALHSGLVSDSSTKSLVYKTVASLLPQDLEVCCACALLVFCQERTLEAYRTVVHLYSLPDQEYHAETTPIGNHVRFDLLQVQLFNQISKRARMLFKYFESGCSSCV